MKEKATMTKEQHSEFCERMALLRYDRECSYSQLGRRIDMNPVTISRIERGLCVPSIESLHLLARGLKTTVAYLMGEAVSDEVTAFGEVRPPKTQEKQKRSYPPKITRTHTWATNRNNRERIGERVTELRKKQWMTRVHFSREVGMSPSAVGGIERGKRNSTVGPLRKIATYFGYTMEEFMSEAPLPEKTQATTTMRIPDHSKVPQAQEVGNSIPDKRPNKKSDTRLIRSDIDQIKNEPNTPNTCLLYTSPSPRD